MIAIFIRHANLKYPYNNYDRLSLKQLDLLATEKTQPHINSRLAKSKIKKHITNGFLAKNRIDAIYYSSAPRAKETAVILADILNVNVTMELDYLKEIAFSPKRLVSDDVFKRKGMKAIREAVYKSVEQDRADETTAMLVSRIKKVKKLIVQHKGQTILVVTHGFFMRLLQISLINNNYVFSVNNQEKAVNHDFLQGFFL